MGELFIKGQKTPYIRNPSREAQIILENWHFFEPRVLFFICLVFLLVSGWFLFCFSARGGGRPHGERNMLESYVWGGVSRMCSAMVAFAVAFPCFCPHGPQTLKYPGACSSTPTFRTRWAATCHSESTPRRGRVAVFPRGGGTVTTCLLLRFGRDGFERFAVGGLACGADLLVPFRAAIVTSLPLPRASCYGRAGAIHDPPALAAEGGRDGGQASKPVRDRAEVRAIAGQNEPARARATWRETARGSKRGSTRGSARKREAARASASKREPARASASESQREARGEGHTDRTRAQKGRQPTTYF